LVSLASRARQHQAAHYHDAASIGQWYVLSFFCSFLITKREFIVFFTVYIVYSLAVDSTLMMLKIAPVEKSHAGDIQILP
jgi:hypothetical protein